MLSEPELLNFRIPNFGQTTVTHKLVCYQWGDPKAKRTVLCSHGLTRNGRDFDYLARELSKEYRVLCPDMPGRGKSQWVSDPAGYSYPAYAAEMTFMLHELGIERLDWIGTSMGGIIGMMMTQAHPDIIRSLTLNDIGCVVSAAGLKRIASFAGSSIFFNTRAEAEADLRARCAPFGITRNEYWQQLYAHSIEQNDNGTFRFAYDPAIAINRQEEGGINDVDLWGLWEPATKIPVLLIRGAQSDILTHETALEMKARHPNLEFHEIPGAGHAPPLMEDGQIAIVKNWLAAKA